jgi:hypothetical protein
VLNSLSSLKACRVCDRSMMSMMLCPFIMCGSHFRSSSRDEATVDDQ